MNSSPTFRTLGDQRVKAELTRAHNRRLHEWCDRAGHFRRLGKQPDSRERLCSCFSLLEGGPADRRLANRIILATPIEACHFSPVIAAELALRFPDRLTRAAHRQLVASVREHYLNLFEVRFGGGGTHNFVCMTTFFLLAAPLLLERFAFKHRFASIPEVYSRERMQEHGRNALLLLAHEWEQRSISNEFNSPTYSPISVMAIAKIVELIPDAKLRALALAVERRHWQETLAFFHPRLSVACGPYSRAYRADVLGQGSFSRTLLTYVGLSRDRSLVDLFEENHPDHFVHGQNDPSFTWSLPAWLTATRYHVPTEALRELQHRRYPKRFSAATHWDAFGLIDAKRGKFVSVHGTVLPAGEADVVQVQHRDWVLGWRTYTAFGHTFPIHLHYALREPVASLRDVRNVLAGVLFQSRPEEWAQTRQGPPLEANNFSHHGHLHVREQAGGLAFEGRPLEGLSPLPTEEISVNSFLPLHFSPITVVRLNGEPFRGQTMNLRAKTARLEVNDHGFQYAVEYRFEKAIPVRLYRWAKFLRFAGFFYEGAPKVITSTSLARMRVRGRVSVLGR